MHRFDPTKSYRGTDESGNTALAIAEMYLLEHRFYEAMRGKMHFQVRAQVTVSLTMDQLAYVLEHMPDAFGDVAPHPVDEMPPDVLKLHEDLMRALGNPESHTAKFVAWLNSR